MNLLHTVTTFIFLISIAKSQNSSKCRGIYDNILEIYALDVCVNNTLLGYPINQKYVCNANNEVENQYWFYNHGKSCNGAPNSDGNRVDVSSNQTVCEGRSNCPYAIIRVYEYNNYCQDYGIWSDRAMLTDVCSKNPNVSDPALGIMLKCNRERGIIRQKWSGENCTGDVISEPVLLPLTGNDTCQKSLQHDQIYARLQSCNERINATSPVPYPTESPTIRPSAGGTYAPSMPPTKSPTYDTTNDTWFITAMVFICLFGVVLLCMVWLAFTVFQQPSRGRQRNYDQAPNQDDDGGVETTNYN